MPCPLPEDRARALTLPGQRTPPVPDDADLYAVKRLQLASRHRGLSAAQAARLAVRDGGPNDTRRRTAAVRAHTGH